MLRLEILSDPEQAQAILRDRPGVGRVHPLDGGLEVEFLGDEGAAADLLAALVAGGVRVTSFSQASSDLEDVFLRLTAGS
jgi:hypothetical protein